MTKVSPLLRRRCQVAILRALKRWAEQLHERWEGPVIMPPATGGKLLEFIVVDSNLGRPVISVRSARGGFSMGTIEWSNQWNLARFKPHYQAVFDSQCIAEIYAAMKGLQ